MIETLVRIAALALALALPQAGQDCECGPKKPTLQACRTLPTHDQQRACVVAYKQNCEGKNR